ncbi:hypothetical protein [Citrobacter phage vB_CfrD-Cit2]
MWVWGEDERAREIWEARRMGRMFGAEHLICGDFGEDVR